MQHLLDGDSEDHAPPRLGGRELLARLDAPLGRVLLEGVPGEQVGAEQDVLELPGANQQAPELVEILGYLRVGKSVELHGGGSFASLG